MADTHGKKIQTMFDRISPRYDLLNRLLSGGSDMRWRRRAVALLGNLAGHAALDLCCGSGDFLLIFRRRHGDTVRLYGADFAANMLRVARLRLDAATPGRLSLVQADALALPYADASMAAVTIGFGIRNIVDKETALTEILRVLAPGGRLAIIEPAIPENRLVAALFKFYFGRVMPFIGGLISGDAAAYRYLNDSVAAFPAPDVFCDLMRRAGFGAVDAIPQTFGTAMIYFGEKRT